MTPLTKTETRTILISQKTYKKDMTLSLNSREIFFESDTLKQFSRPLDRFPKGLIPFHELENGLFFGSGWLYIDKVFFLSLPWIAWVSYSPQRPGSLTLFFPYILSCHKIKNTVEGKTKKKKTKIAIGCFSAERRTPPHESPVGRKSVCVCLIVWEYNKWLPCRNNKKKEEVFVWLDSFFFEDDCGLERKNPSSVPIKKRSTIRGR